ncbi:MAG: hypothetical protein WBD02_08610 [Acidimicrobiia bacterium]
MKFLAAVAVACAVALIVGIVTGTPIALRPGATRGPRREGKRSQLLAQSGLHISQRQMMISSAALFTVTFLLTAAMTGVPPIALAPAVVAARIPWANIERARRRRIDSLRRSWPDALRDLLATVIAGGSLHQGLIRMAADGPEPVREVFASFEGLSRMVGVGPALEVIRDDLADPISDRILEILSVAHERGGTIVVEIISDLIRSSTMELKLADEIDSAGLESRINARAVLGLPWLVLVFLCIGNKDFRAFYASSAGLLVVAVGAVLSAGGAWLLRKLGAPQAEHRVFGSVAPMNAMNA